MKRTPYGTQKPHCLTIFLTIYKNICSEHNHWAPSRHCSFVQNTLCNMYMNMWTGWQRLGFTNRTFWNRIHSKQITDISACKHLQVLKHYRENCALFCVLLTCIIHCYSERFIYSIYETSIPFHRNRFMATCDQIQA